MIESPAFVCPSCRARLVVVDGARVCHTCVERFNVDDGIPVLVVAGGSTTSAQASYFDHGVDEEFEIERPRGAPTLYQRLLEAKFRRATGPVELRGASVLVVCGGSGMDAEFLARAGARVVSSDVSIGAARRARERARRHGVEYSVVVADAERLPFEDRSFDVAYVHDGLHHLDRPLAGLAEMARVARLAVCVTEPARAAVTALAVKLGLAEDVEEAGNRVARLTPAELGETLRRSGFRVVRARRYGMYYRHEPGPVMSLLSSRPLLAPATVGLRLAASAAAPIGNKLAVVAVRG